MTGLICLGAGLLCALIARGLIIAPAFSISFRWGIGVLLPFGPLFFRLSYPEQALPARIFGLISLPCYLAFVTFGPGLGAFSLPKKEVSQDLASTSKSTGYAIETSTVAAPGPQTPAMPLDQRSAANEAEFARLRSWSEKLLTTKRDLLRTDLEASRRYNQEATQFNSALAAANAEKSALEPAP